MNGNSLGMRSIVLFGSIFLSMSAQLIAQRLIPEVSAQLLGREKLSGVKHFCIRIEFHPRPSYTFLEE